MAFNFSLAYHSSRPMFPGAPASSVGLGWTHSYNETLRPTDFSGDTLYRLTGEGYEEVYTRQADGFWKATLPGVLRGRVGYDETVGAYLLTDLDGTVTAFDAASGNWLSTTDRWGNTIEGQYDTFGQLTTITDTEGRAFSLTYSGSLLTQLSLPGGATWRFTYSGANLVGIYDPIHTGPIPWRALSYVADSRGVEDLLSQVQDESGATLEAHTYDAVDRGVTSSAAGGRDLVTVEYESPGAGQDTVIHSIDGTVSQQSVFSLIYQRGQFLPLTILGDCATCGGGSDSYTFQFDASNHVTQMVDGEGHVTNLQYDADGNVTVRTEGAGTTQAHTTAFTYGYTPWPTFWTEKDEPSAARSGGLKVTMREWSSSSVPETTLTVTENGYLDPTTPTSYVSASDFDDHHRLVSSTGPRTDLMQRTFRSYYPDADADVNRRGRLASVVDPATLTTTYADYDVFGTPRGVTDPNGVRTELLTDGRGRVVSSTSKAVSGDPNEATDYTTVYTFDGRDRLISTHYPRGNSIRYIYEDGTNRLTDTVRVDYGGKEVERRHFTLNLIGDRITEEDQACTSPELTCASWQTRRSEGFLFDAHNRLVRVDHVIPSGSFVENDYDSDGLLASVQDEDHARPNTLYAYDSLHRLTSVRQVLAGGPSGQVATSYTYDVMDNLASVTDPNGNTTTYEYDDFHRLSRQSSPVTGTTTYEYDEAGNLVSTADARGAATTKSYDADNRVTSSTSQLPGQDPESVTWSYDAFGPGNFGRGRVATMTDPSGSASYRYERRGLLTTENKSILGTSYQTSYQYGVNGNRYGITYPSGRQVTYSFDAADRPASVTAGASTIVSSASYLPFGPESQLVFGNGTTRAAAFDHRYRPLEIKLAKGASVLADYLYQEDPVGNITQVHDAQDGSYNRDFSYDDLYRLTGAATGYSLWGQGSYAYDSMGNMKSLTLGASRSATFAYNGSLPTLDSVTQDGVAQPVAYDAAGNQIGVGTSIYAYSARNFLAQGDGLSYTYDGRGVRTVTTLGGQTVGTVTGSIMDAGANASLSGATVTISGTAIQTSTDSAGTFTLLAPAGTYTLTVTHRGYTPSMTGAFPIDGGQSFDMGTILLSIAPGTITGNVISASGGGAVPLVTVTVSPGGASAATDAQGNFSIPQPPGTYLVTFVKTGYVSTSVPAFTLAAGEVHTLSSVQLSPSNAAVSGTVVDSVTLSPLAGVSVAAVPVSGGAIPTLAPKPGRIRAQTITFPAPGSTTTNSAGQFNLSVRPGTYNISVAGASYVTHTIQRLTLGPGAALSLGTLPIDPMGAVTGTVVSAEDGSPVSGADVAVVGTLNSAVTDPTGAFTISQGPGTYSLSISAAGFETFVTDPFTLPAGGAHSAGTLELRQTALSVYVGYADNVRSSSSFPVPWQGSPNTVFIGNASSFWDAGAIRLDNNTTSPIPIDGVQADLQRPGPTFDLWGKFTIPAKSSVILTQTETANFDTSDFAIVGCGQPLLANDPRIPKVTISIGGIPTSYFDTSHVLDTGGFDSVCRGNESLQWSLIGTSLTAANRTFQLTPSTGTAALGSTYTLKASLVDAANQPVQNVVVTFTAVVGPNRGRTGQATTDVSGVATFSYAGNLSGTDTWQATIPNASGGSTTSNPATVAWPSLAGLKVYVGYADGLRASPSFPIPWQGAPNVVFIGHGPTYDAGAVRLDNTTTSGMTVSSVVVDLQRPGPSLNLWGSFTIPAGSSAILTQTGEYNFDTSDYPVVGCGGIISSSDSRIPKVTVTIAGQSASYLDVGHILDTFGKDLATCGGSGNESLQWRPVGSSSTEASGQLLLGPPTARVPVGASDTVTALALDAAGEPLPSVNINFRVLSGPDAGATGSGTTGSLGVANFTFAGAATGSDVVQASFTNSSGAVSLSNNVSIVWIPQVSIALSPSSDTRSVGESQNLTASVTDSLGNPVADLLVTFLISSGPNHGKMLTAATNSSGEAYFTYTGTVPGTDSVTASVEGTDGQVGSAPSTIHWQGETYYVITLSPPTATDVLGSTRILTATVVKPGGFPAAGISLGFDVTEGPDAGAHLAAVSGAQGEASLSLTGQSVGTDSVVASVTADGNSFSSNISTVQWVGIATTLISTGPTAGEWNDPVTFSALLAETDSGQPLAGQVVTFALGSQSAPGTTNAQGVATATITPNGVPGATPLSISFAGSNPYLASSASPAVTIDRDETTIAYTGSTTLALGTLQTLSAKLTDGEDGQPAADKMVTFALAGITASGTTDASGTATASVDLALAQATGQTLLTVSFGGDTYGKPAQAETGLLLYVPESFVLWGGNPGGLHLNQPVNFWGNQWWKQVFGGDYSDNGNFKGYAGTLSAFAVCEATAHTDGTPPLDQACWSAKTGESFPPEGRLPEHIGVLVSDAIVEGSDRIYGNVAALVVIDVSPKPAYGPDPGKPGYGVIEAVIADPQGLVGANQPAGSATPSPGSPVSRYFLYTPELNLMTETELTPNTSPSILYEYIWFNGHPIAQIDGTTAVHWTFTDHLGTPILQTDSNGMPYWRAEYEPYGAVFQLRTADQHQPLRLPGQEAEQLNLGSNGLTSKSYNIFRWYQPWWGSYAEADPLGVGGQGFMSTLDSLPQIISWHKPRESNQEFVTDDFVGSTNPFEYAVASPTGAVDQLGLYCGPGRFFTAIPLLDWSGYFNFHQACRDHDRCYGQCGWIKATCDNLFLDAMLDDCRTRHPLTRAPCQLRALAYYAAVARGGDRSFQGAQATCHGCGRSEPKSRSGRPRSR